MQSVREFSTYFAKKLENFVWIRRFQTKNLAQLLVFPFLQASIVVEGLQQWFIKLLYILIGRNPRDLAVPSGSFDKFLNFIER